MRYELDVNDFTSYDSTFKGDQMPRPGVGYQGQRYEVRYIASETGEEKVMGWTNASNGGGLLTAAFKWPAVKERPDGSRIAWVVDLRPGT